ncbi:hypothetical protein FPV67DRAFT_635806 [Lyophyllum atratum]|nr:hypothetical protein FPV67DRAFT_635806 [Lyophyllum atratum]
MGWVGVCVRWVVHYGMGVSTPLRRWMGLFCLLSVGSGERCGRARAYIHPLVYMELTTEHTLYLLAAPGLGVSIPGRMPRGLYWMTHAACSFSTCSSARFIS